MLPRLLDSNMRETKRLNALDASITERIIPLSTATVILPDTETLPLRSWVRMFNGYGESAIYRVNTPGLNIDNCTSEYQLDHGVCEIGDYIINSDAEYSGAANTVISQIFSNYRGSLWQLGTVAATDQVEVNSDHGDVLSALLDAVEQLPDYAISLDQSATPWTFAVVAKSSAVGGEGRLSRNIASLDISEDTSALCTRLYGDALTGGHMDADTISLYGVVEQYAGKGEGTTQEKYLADCQKYLNQHKHPLRVIKIDLHDLHAVTGEPLDKAELGKLYRLALPKYNITESQRVFAREWPSLYGDPEHIVVTLGNEAMDMNALFDSYSATSASNASSEKRKSEAQSAKWRFTDKHVTDQGEILHAAGLEIDAHGVWLYASEQGADYALGSSFKVQADAITAEVTRATTAEGTMSSRITQTADAITAEVTRATEAEGTMSSRITQTADAITAEVTRASEAEGTLSSQIKQTADQISLKVSKGDVSTQLAVECGNVSISGGNLVVSGYITSQGLITTMGNFNGNISATGSIAGQSLAGGTITLNGESLTSHSITWIGGSLTMFAGDQNLDIRHYHEVTFSNGKFTIGGATTTAPDPFDITATTWYKNQIAAATNSVNVTKTWEDNECFCNPSKGTGTGQTITITQSTANPTSMAPNLYRVTIKDGSTTVLYFTVDATARYNAGENAGYTSGYSDGVNDGYATGQAAFSAKSYTRYGTLAYYDDSQDKYVSAGYGYWFLSNSKTLYEKS